MLHKIGSRRRLVVLLPLAFCAVMGVYGGPAVRVHAALASSALQLGGSAELQIQVEGSDHPGRPQPPEVKGISLVYDGGSSNDSTQITVVNGNQSTVVSRGFLYTYTLRAERIGAITIPPFLVTVNGRTYRTNPLALNVSKPVKTNAFILHLSLGGSRLYVGEATVLTVMWYISEDVADVSFHLPILDDPSFETRALPPETTSADVVQLPVGKGRVNAVRGPATVNGRSYTLIQFREVVVPKRAGHFSFTNSSLELTTNPSASSFFNSFFGNSSAPQTFVVPGNTIDLVVRPLPTRGRPTDFSGLIGQFTLASSASPTTVNVGDPIAFKIRLSGGADIASASIPAIATMPGFSGSFKMPPGQLAGTTTGATKLFSTTIRATSDKVHSIPSVQVPYFDPSTGRYEVLRSRPIKLVVRPTRILTAKDLQGAPAAPAKSLGPTASTVGIDYNYEGRRVLAPANYSPAAALLRPLPASLGGVPLLAFLVLLARRIVRRGSRSGSRLRQAERELRSLCASSDGGQERLPRIFAAFRRYLGLRLDVGREIDGYEGYRSRLPTPQIEAQVRELFAIYDKHRYSPVGTSALEEGTRQLAEGCIEVADLLSGRGAK